MNTSPIPAHITVRPLHRAVVGDTVLLTVRGIPTWGVVLCQGETPGTLAVDLQDRMVEAVDVMVSTGAAVPCAWKL